MASDYGHRPYMTDKPFSEQMRLFTDKAVGDLHPVRHSEFKQPYLHWSYPEMEYWWDWPPWMTIEFPGIDFPWLTPYLPNMKRLIENPCDFTFYADLDDVCWCPGETLCYYVAVFHPIVAVKLTNPEWHGGDFNVTGITNMVCITASSDPMGNPEVDVFMRAICDGRPVDGSHEGILISECWPPDDKCCNGENYNPPQWDSAESIETIDQDETGIVAVVDDGYDEIYGLPPYTWSVSGTDFSLKNTKTMSKTNVLIAGESACGMAVITVTDRCGNQCTGYVECAEGAYSAIECDDYYVAISEQYDVGSGQSPYDPYPCDISPGKIWDWVRAEDGCTYAGCAQFEITCDMRTWTYADCINYFYSIPFFDAPNGLWGGESGDGNPCETASHNLNDTCQYVAGLPDGSSECEAVIDFSYNLGVCLIGQRDWECGT